MFRSSLFLTLSLLPLAALFAGGPTAPKISGTIRFDCQAPFEPADLSNNIYLSQASLKFKGKLMDEWKYEIVTQHPAKFYTLSLEDDVIRIKSAVAKWEYQEQQLFAIGKTSPRFAQSSAPSNSYIQRDVGVLDESIGDQLGFKAEGLMNDKYGYSFGVWKATARQKVDIFFYSEIPLVDPSDSVGVADVTEIVGGGGETDVTLSANNDLKFGFGGRFNAVFHNTENFMWGGGVGYQGVNVIVPLIVEYNSGSIDEPLSAFENRYAVTVDQSIGSQYATLNLGLQHMNYERENNSAVSTPMSSIADGINAFQTKNIANSGYAEVTYLLVGTGYSMNKDYGVINNPGLTKQFGALELAVRYGVASYFNAAAAQYLNKGYNSSAAVPFVFTKKTGYNIAVIDPTLMTNSINDEDFHVMVSGFSVDVNYFMNENIKYKVEYYNSKVQVRADAGNTTLEKRQGVKVRAEYSF